MNERCWHQTSSQEGTSGTWTSVRPLSVSWTELCFNALNQSPTDTGSSRTYRRTRCPTRKRNILQKKMLVVLQKWSQHIIYLSRKSSERLGGKVQKRKCEFGLFPLTVLAWTKLVVSSEGGAKGYTAVIKGVEQAVCQLIKKTLRRQKQTELRPAEKKNW